MLTLRPVGLLRQKKVTGKDCSELSVKHGMSSATSPFGLMESKLFFPPYVQRGDFFLARIMTYFKAHYIVRRGGGGVGGRRERHVIFLEYILLCPVIPHLPNNLWDECIT